MKLSRSILEKLLETNAEAYSLLHQQYTVLDTRYNQLENEYRRTVHSVQENGLVTQEAFDEVKSAYTQASLLLAQAQEELNTLTSARIENLALLERVNELEHQEFWKNKYTGNTFDLEIEDTAQ